jgi:hypothetical protein
VAILPKPEKPAPAPRRRIASKCECGHAKRAHENPQGTCLAQKDGSANLCRCPRYRPARSSVLRSPIARKSAPARTKRKLMPKCKHCAHPHGKHNQTPAAQSWPWGCSRCAACPGYEPAIGIRQKRRTPAAALKLRCDNLWSAIVHHRPEACEVQRFWPHACVGGPQAMHGIPRTFKVTRHLPINGFKGCAGIHTFFTARKEMWDSVLLDAWGEPTFRELWSKARAMQPVDMSATYAALKAEAALRGIE